MSAWWRLTTHPPRRSQMAPRAASPAPSSLPGPRLLSEHLNPTSPDGRDELYPGRFSLLWLVYKWTKQGPPHQITHSSQLWDNKENQTWKANHTQPLHGRLTTHSPLLTLLRPVPGTVLHIVGTRKSVWRNEWVNAGMNLGTSKLHKRHWARHIFSWKAARQEVSAPCYKGERPSPRGYMSCAHSHSW